MSAPGTSRLVSRQLTVSLILLVSFALLAASAHGARRSRGIGLVPVRTEEGKKVNLYRGSHALLVGVSDYTAGWPDLESIPGELKQLEKALRRQGFSVKRVMNPNSRGMEKAFKDFINKHGFDPENRLLFFYSGHGYTRTIGKRKKGYLVPADAPDPNRDDRGFARKSISMSLINTWARDIEAKHALFLFDSCFSGTIFKTRALPNPRHITDKTSHPVRQFITAGSAGEEVPARSVFLPSFIRAIEGDGDVDGDGYVTGTELGQYLHKTVLSYNTGQTPQFGKIRDPDLDEGDFVFLSPKTRKSKGGAAVAARDSGARQPAGAPLTINAEEEFWRAIKDSRDRADFEAYLESYPTGRFTPLARLKLRKLKPAAQPAPAPPVAVAPRVAVPRPPVPVAPRVAVPRPPVIVPAPPVAVAVARPPRAPKTPKPEQGVWKGHTSNVISVVFSPDGSKALSASWDKTLKLWEVSTGRVLRTFRGRLGQVESAVFSPDGRTILSGHWDKTLKLRDAATGRLLRTFRGHGAPVSAVAFSPDGRKALSGSEDKTVRLWDVASGRELRRFMGHTNMVKAVAYAPDGRTALSASWDTTLKLWDLASGRELRSFRGHSRLVESVVFSPDGRMALSGSQDETLILWDVATGRELREFEEHSEMVKSVAFSPDGRMALSGSKDKTVKLWNVTTGKLLRTFTGHTGWVYFVTISPDGRSALSASADKTVRLWPLN